MKFPPSLLDDIRARLPVSEVVRSRVKLKKTGREWIGLSPFNVEKTPSFTVNDQKGFYHDFSSGKHGDIFEFMMDAEGLSFPEAVERAAALAGVTLPKRSDEDERNEKRRADLHEVLAMAAALFEQTLHEGVGAKARGYLADRQIEPATQRQFGVGFAPAEGLRLVGALGARGADAATLVAAGLVIESGDGHPPFDRFRDRVMFPIHDRVGRVVAFGGRALSPGAKAKYLNSPETELFRKGELLFNHHRARKPALDKGALIVVEGYVDVVMMTQAGFAETVAPLGTALTVDQCRLLWSMASEPTLCFDGDAAGLRAAHRAIDLALPLIGADRSLKFALLPDGQDPDDLVRGAGRQAVEEILARAEPFADMLFRREIEGRVFDTPERRAGLERRLRELVATIEDETLRRHYAEDMRRRVRDLFNPPATAEPNRRRDLSFRPGRPAGRFDAGPRLGVATAPLRVSREATRPARDPPREITLIALLISHPSLCEAYLEEIAGLELSSSALAALRDRLVTLPAEAYSDAASLFEALGAAGAADGRDRVLALAGQRPHWRHMGPEAARHDAERVFRQALALHRKSGALDRELRAAERAFANDPTEQNFARLKDARDKQNDLVDAEAMAEGFGDVSEEDVAPL